MMRKRTAFLLLILGLLLCATAQAGDFLTLDVTGSRSDDSIQVNLTVTDTTLYPTIADAEDLYVLRFKPNGDLLDSTHTSSTNMFKMRTGWYSAHFRASSPDSALGIYSIYAAVKVGGAWRGHVAGSYQVLDQRYENYLTKIDSLIISADSLLVTTEQISFFLGACDGCVKAYLPNDGTQHKNGYEIYYDGVKKLSVYFGHSNDPAVLDSASVTKEN